MTAEELLDHLITLGITLHPSGDKLRLKGKTQRLTPPLREELIRQKPALLGLASAHQAKTEAVCVRCRKAPRVTTTPSFHCAACRREGIAQLNTWRRSHGLEPYDLI